MQSRRHHLPHLFTFTVPPKKKKFRKNKKKKKYKFQKKGGRQLLPLIEQLDAILICLFPNSVVLLRRCNNFHTSTPSIVVMLEDESLNLLPGRDCYFVPSWKIASNLVQLGSHHADDDRACNINGRTCLCSSQPFIDGRNLLQLFNTVPLFGIHLCLSCFFFFFLNSLSVSYVSSFFSFFWFVLKNLFS